MNEPATATVTLTDPVCRLANGNVQETVIDVTITSAAHHTAYLLHAAVVAADEGLRAVSRTHPAHRSAQCGRTFTHASHETTEGRCAGLDGSEVEEVDWEGTVEALRSGLKVIRGNGCAFWGDDKDCWDKGRTADAPTFIRRACGACIARLVLDGETLPVEADRG